MVKKKRGTKLLRGGIIYNYGRSMYSDILKYDYCFDTNDGYRINSSLMYNQKNLLAKHIIAQFNELTGLF